MKFARIGSYSPGKSYIRTEEPELKEGESMLFEGRPRLAGYILAGIIALFIPPFIFGPLIIWYGLRKVKHGKTIVTNLRVIQIEKQLFGSKLEIEEFPIDAYCNIHPAANPLNPIKRMLIGESKLGFGYRDGDGTVWYSGFDIIGDSAFVRKLKKAIKDQNKKA